MKPKFKTIGIFSNSDQSRSADLCDQVNEILSNIGCKVLVDNRFKQKKHLKAIKAYTRKYISSKADLVIAIGGDGTMLSCSREYGFHSIPILGINLGKLGFLTDIAPDELTTKLLEVISGKFEYDKRFFLETNIEGKNKRVIALNEIVIHSGAIAQLIEYDLYIDNIFVYRQKADGLIINTPTGSTAYSLSGGGPIVHPNLDAITLLPMFPHSLSSSPLIIESKSVIKFKLINSSKHGAMLSSDSHESIELEGIEEITISKSNSLLKLVHPIDHDFYDGCRNKLGWSSSIAR